jgi:phosphatidate cytidylyltransferase
MAIANPLLLRVLTGAVLAAVALTAVWLGGTAFTALAAAAALLMFAEWAVMLRLGRGIRLAGLVLIAGVILLMSLVSIGEVVLALAGGAGLIGLFARGIDRRLGFWATAGILYCGLPVVALIWLRGLTLGLPATVFVLALVWTTDIAAYFVGRAIGGPKFAPAISPNKTWAGVFGGIMGAMAVGFGLSASYLPGGGGSWTGFFTGIAGAIAVVAILGDLFESWLKRRAGVKDSGRLLPGHGGALDRLDGMVPAAIAGALVFAGTGWAG